MILSRVRIDLNGLPREALFDVMNASAYSAHQLLWQLFSEHDERPFLFRQELETESGAEGQSPRGLPLFYVLSREAPDTRNALFQIESKTFEPSLSVGDRLAFRLRANPTVDRRSGPGSQSRRSDVLMHAKSAFPAGQRGTRECADAVEAAAVEWLATRAATHGFSVPVHPITGAYRQHVIRKKNQPRASVRFSSLDYEGQLEVADPARFLETLAAGIGRAKAFGCGLMLVRPVSGD